jgi:CheY-like chemotaxis protein
MKTILVIDDDPVSIRLIEMIAARYGYETVSRSSGHDALAWLDTADSVEMVISDQRMANMTGLELYSTVRTDVRFRHLPFILCTGFADETTVREAIRLGIRHFIVKPITPKVVMEKITLVESERPRMMEPRDAAMARLRLSDLEYKSLVRTCREHILTLRNELSKAFEGGDRVTMVMVAARLREPITLVDATRLLQAIDGLESTRTWKDLEDAARLVFREIGELEVALEQETRPHLAGRSMGSLAP